MFSAVFSNDVYLFFISEGIAFFRLLTYFKIDLDYTKISDRYLMGGLRTIL